MPRDLSKDEIASILAKSKRKPRGKKYDFKTRTVANWFTIPHSMGTCSNEDCESPAEKGGRNRMVADIDGHIMCRICFVAGWRNDE
jgi:hypothetical protein